MRKKVWVGRPGATTQGDNARGKESKKTTLADAKAKGER
jgi:hypothetical protein